MLLAEPFLPGNGCFESSPCVCSADEYTLCFMENNRHEYSMADWEAAVATTKAALQGDTPPFKRAQLCVISFLTASSHCRADRILCVLLCLSRL